MKNKSDLLMAGKAGFVLGAVLLATLSGPVSYADGIHVGVTVDPNVVVAPAVAPDDYLYYPAYGVYYSSHRHEYAYQDHGAWVSRPAPPSVSADVLRASPSVKMDFHDSPANHHATIVQKYPKNWAPSHATEGRRDDDRGGK
jgi:hypothetical protein